MIKLALVDDKRINIQSLIDRIRHSPDFQIVFTASDGEDFLEKCKLAKDLPDVVFMDIDMPVMNGIEAVSIASELYPSIKFIMLTVFDDDDKIFEAIKSGAVGYLLKEESADKLIQHVRDVVEFGVVPMSPRIARKTLQLLSRAHVEVVKNKEDVLSEREVDILRHLINGLDYRQISERLFISPNTVRTHISNIYKKLHVNNKAQAIKIAYKKGIV
ncbi:DNA-binding response regulator [Thermaurantimonas aggregans]|uniref:DNA-binding response regulator n=1 Tax=Thermaurantimonas aggregans TaxID=2173829 RepID=A0A401XJ55_9FLAO|nr:response regulator transcription factor [Thermaurantimonas aggregans]MCX8149661.1 response regulator transcription factor [Thermaurantimonas aggregans]GCD77059.1 DNA-binding response regulator [Thermaurantimonas aggregans]